MKEMELTRGMKALVDDDDFECLNQWKWKASKFGKKWYACRSVHIGPPGVVHSKEGTVLMHRAILKLTDPKVKTDHRDGNGLNNQKNNLRCASYAQNAQNRKKRDGGSSSFKGVYRNKKSWVAQIKCNSEHIHIGSYSSEVTAARAYDSFARSLHGEFAVTNFKEKLCR